MAKSKGDRDIWGARFEKASDPKKRVEPEDPTWSPDSEDALARFEEEFGGTVEQFLASLRGASPRPITDDDAPDDAPEWAQAISAALDTEWDAVGLAVWVLEQCYRFPPRTKLQLAHLQAIHINAVFAVAATALETDEADALIRCYTADDDLLLRWQRLRLDAPLRRVIAVQPKYRPRWDAVNSDADREAVLEAARKEAGAELDSPTLMRLVRVLVSWMIPPRRLPRTGRTEGLENLSRKLPAYGPPDAQSEKREAAVAGFHHKLMLGARADAHAAADPHLARLFADDDGFLGFNFTKLDDELRNVVRRAQRAAEQEKKRADPRWQAKRLDKGVDAGIGEAELEVAKVRMLRVLRDIRAERSELAGWDALERVIENRLEGIVTEHRDVAAAFGIHPSTLSKRISEFLGLFGDSK